MNIRFDEIRLLLVSLAPKLADLKEALTVDALKKEIAELEEKTAAAGFWDDPDNSRTTLQLISRLKNKVGSYEKLKNDVDEALSFTQMCMEEGEDDLLPELEDNVSRITATLEEMTLSTLLTGEYDQNNAILTFHAGAGGTEAQDWVSMLHRMYLHWGERKGYNVKTLDFLDGEEAGLKSISILVEGYNAYGFLRSETGVHRLVRISPFDSSGRRHTSFASLEVMPEISDDVQIDIRAEDLKVDTYRSGGAGGQHVNKTESAIRITHIPTGIVVACQNERSQVQNREVAMKMLKSKLIEIKEREHLDRIEDIKGDQKDIGWGSQIRSYVFMPYTLVKDHRTGYEQGNIGAVMDGDLDGFINAYLKQQATDKS